MHCAAFMLGRKRERARAESFVISWGNIKAVRKRERRGNEGKKEGRIEHFVQN